VASRAASYSQGGQTVNATSGGNAVAVTMAVQYGYTLGRLTSIATNAANWSIAYNMLQDPKKLFTLAYDVPNRALTGTSTTWVGHRPGLQGMIDNINAMIALGQRMGCDMTTEIIAAGALYIPNAPFNP